MTQVTLMVNGTQHNEDVSDYMLLADFIREKLKLTGTHIGCDTSQCGACVIHIDGISVKSCTMLAVQADGCNITTIEGLADGDVLHPMQQAERSSPIVRWRWPLQWPWQLRDTYGLAAIVP